MLRELARIAVLRIFDDVQVGVCVIIREHVPVVYQVLVTLEGIQFRHLFGIFEVFLYY